jgi:hypothetical protein
LVQQHFLIPQALELPSTDSLQKQGGSTPSSSSSSNIASSAPPATTFTVVNTDNSKGNTPTTPAYVSPSAVSSSFPDNAFVDAAIKIREEEKKEKVDMEKRKMGDIEFEKALKEHILKKKIKVNFLPKPFP